jgi:hypothetical protein
MLGRLIAVVCGISLFAGPLYARKPIAIIESGGGWGGHQLVIDVAPGEVLTVVGKFDAGLPHWLRIMDDKGNIIGDIQKPGGRRIITNSGRIRIADQYDKGRQMTPRYRWSSLQTLDVRDDYQKVGSEDGSDRDYNDAIIEITVSR